MKIQLPFNENQGSLLQNISQKILSTREWEDLVQLIVHGAVSLVGGEGALFFVLDKSLNDFIIQGSFGFANGEAKEIISLCKPFFEHNQSSVFNAKQNFIKAAYKNGELYILPLKQDHAYSGILVLRINNYVLTEQQLNLLEAYMQCISVAVENSRLYLQIQRKSNSLTLMNKLQQLLGRGSFEEILTETVTKVGTLLDAQMAGVMLYDSNRNELVLQKPAFGVWDDTIIDQYHVSLKAGGNAVAVFLSMIPTITNDAPNDGRYLNQFIRLFGNAKSIITVPLTVDGRRIGVLHAVGNPHRMFTQDDLTLLMDIVNHLGMIIDGALQMQGTSVHPFNRAEVEQYMTSQIVQGMIRGHLGEMEYIINNKNMLRLPTTPPFIVIVLSFMFNESVNNAFLKEHIHLIEETIRFIVPASAATVEEDDIVIVCSYEQGSHAEQIGRAMQTQLRSLLQTKKCPVNHDLDIVIGIGKRVGSLYKIKDSYQQAKRVVKFLPLLPNTNNIGYYPDLGIWSLLAELSGHQEVVNMFMHHYLQAINNMKNTYKHTLQAFLANEGHLKKTASDLYIHINTLKYRIEKIEHEVGIDLSDPETRLNINIALRLEHMAQITDSVPEM